MSNVCSMHGDLKLLAATVYKYACTAYNILYIAFFTLHAQSLYSYNCPTLQS